MLAVDITYAELKAMSLIANKKGTQHYEQVLRFERKNGRLRIVVFTSCMGAIYTLNDHEDGPDEAFHLPASTIDELVKLKGFERVIISSDGKTIRVCTRDDIEVEDGLSGSDYPPYERVLPDPTKPIKTKPAQFDPGLLFTIKKAVKLLGRDHIYVWPRGKKLAVVAAMYEPRFVAFIMPLLIEEPKSPLDRLK